MSEELTFGQKAVGLTFNPSGDKKVLAIKDCIATAIDHVHDFRGRTTSQEVQRMCAIAITDLQTAQMWAVKAVTWDKP